MSLASIRSPVSMLVNNSPHFDDSPNGYLFNLVNHGRYQRGADSRRQQDDAQGDDGDHEQTCLGRGWREIAKAHGRLSREHGCVNSSA